MKIKKFRIKSRLGIVARNLRSMMAVKQLSDEVERSIESESAIFSSQITPLAFYNTWTGAKIPETFQSILQKSSMGKPVAVSVIIATIGTGPEEELTKTLMSGATQKSQIWTALSEDAADISFNFIFKLLAEDASKDDCDIPEVVMVTDTAVLTESLELTNAARENIRLENGHLSPRFTRVGLAVWVPVSKKKASSILAKKAN